MVRIKTEKKLLLDVDDVIYFTLINEVLDVNYEIDVFSSYYIEEVISKEVFLFLGNLSVEEIYVRMLKRKYRYKNFISILS